MRLLLEILALDSIFCLRIFVGLMYPFEHGFFFGSEVPCYETATWQF